MKRRSSLLFLFLYWLQAGAQGDTLKVLTIEEFMAVVRQFHPVARQSQLIPEQARAELRIARGGWDPLIYSDYNSKTFDGKNYFSYFENTLKIPTWYGVEVKAGYDFAYGEFISDENKLPQQGLGYVGLSVPVLRNLLMDKKRAALRQAQLFREASEQQRLLMLNDLLFDALKAYYDWSYAYNEYLIMKNAVAIADIRMQATVKSAVYGDRPMIDTVEALAQLQTRQIQLNDARLRFLNNGLELSNYLWLDNDQVRPWDTTIVPAILTSDFIGQDIQLRKADELETEVRTQHPAILNYNLKLRQLDIERRLKLEGVKPLLNVNYNILANRFGYSGSANNIFANNYKFGLNFSMPFTFAEGRGQLRLTKLKILDTRYTLNLKTQELVTKVRSYFNELITLQAQTRIFESTVDNYRRLFEGELQRFNTGESSVFLVNARENSYINAQVKLREYQAKYYKTEAAVKWAAGNIGR